MKRILIYLLLASLSFGGFAQSVALGKADRMFELYAFSQAAEAYEKLYSKKQDDPYLIQQLAKCYNEMRLYNLALEFYELHLKGNLVTNEDIYTYAELLLVDEQLEKATEYFKQYMKLEPNDNRPLLQLERIESFEQLNFLHLVDTVFLAEFNTRFGDMSPMFYKDDIVFISARDSMGATYSWDAQPFLDIYQFELNKKGEKEIVKVPEINTRYHEGPVAFTNNFNTIYLTRNNESIGKNDGGTNNLKIYISNWNTKKEKWDKETEFQYNSNVYSVGHPAFSSDGKTLYFASNMDGSYGKTDLFKASKIENINKKGDTIVTWTTPENLGAQFNTEGNEMFPYVDERGVIFFASDGLGGFGGLDIYAAFPVADTFNVLNLGQPINSTYDDFGLIIDWDFVNGYFTSNRPSRKGSDDIYSFAIGLQHLNVTVKSLASKLPIEGAAITQIVEGKSEAIGATNAEGFIVVDIDYHKKNIVVADHPQYISNRDSVLPFDIFKLQHHAITIFLDNTSMLQGLVVSDENGDPLEGVKIRIDFQRAKDVEFITDGSGKIQLPIKQADVANITILKEDYEVDQQTINIDKIGEGNFSFSSRLKLLIQESKVEGTIVNNEDGSILSGASVKVKFNEKIFNLTSDEKGMVSFSVNEPGQATIHAQLEGYVSDDIDIIIKETGKQDFTFIGKLDPIYKGKTIVLENLYYDLNSSIIRADAAMVLDQLNDILTENPSMKIELSSHTDCRGKDEYNLWLSEKRAQSAVKYLIENGIKKNRLEAKGYGETKLVNECANGVQCSEEQHQQNRRTEFTILEL